MARTILNLVIFVLFLNEINGDIVVETSSGKVAGVEKKSILDNERYYSFMGIPYAKKPVGDLRFKPPQPHEGWSDILNAKKEKKICAQNNMHSKVVKEYGYCGQEDCLHLSIHTPKLPTDEELNLPTIVFLYNEQFKVTHNNSREYGPDFFMYEGVIIVTINYRIGVLGFISFEDDLIPGNNGIRDVILGLKWLQENIRNFGGDPNKVTLMGVVGGGALVDILLHSPKAKGLFSAVILQSGTSWNSMYFPDNPKKKALALAEVLEKKVVLSSHLIKEFAPDPAIQIVGEDYQAIETDEASSIQRAVYPFSAVLEHEHPDAIITKAPEDIDLNIDIPVMIGYNSRESIEVCEHFFRKPQFLTFVDRDLPLLFPIRVGYHFEINSKVYNKAIKEIKDFYFDEGYVKISHPSEYLTYTGDFTSFYPVDYTVRKYVNESKSSVYYYTFDYSGELNLRKQNALKNAITIEGTWGAATGDELCYLFVCKSIKKAYEKVLRDQNSDEFKVISNMVKMWSNFAKTGNPTPPGSDFIWTPASRENKEVLVISDELQIRTNLYQDRVKFWDDFIAKYKEKAIDGVVKDKKDEL